MDVDKITEGLSSENLEYVKKIIEKKMTKKKLINYNKRLKNLKI